MLKQIALEDKKKKKKKPSFLLIPFATEQSVDLNTLKNKQQQNCLNTKKHSSGSNIGGFSVWNRRAESQK